MKGRKEETNKQTEKEKSYKNDCIDIFGTCLLRGSNKLKIYKLLTLLKIFNFCVNILFNS